MAEIPQKIFKYALGKHRSVKNSLWIAACFLLIGVNVCFFLFFPHLLSSVAIVLSNVIFRAGRRVLRRYISRAR